jgi:hypothetical protein
VRLRERDLQLLCWTSEQYAVRLDQAAVWLGRSESIAWRWADRCRAHGLVRMERWTGGRSWVWLTGRGERQAGAGFSKPWRPSVGRLAHVAAVNEVRLHVEARSADALWVPERVLARERDRRNHLPDAEVHIPSECHAIEVELVPKAKHRIVRTIDELSRRYDRVVYFCSPKARHRWSLLVLRDVPIRGATRPPRGDEPA